MYAQQSDTKQLWSTLIMAPGRKYSQNLQFKCSHPATCCICWNAIIYSCLHKGRNVQSLHLVTVHSLSHSGTTQTSLLSFYNNLTYIAQLAIKYINREMSVSKDIMLPKVCS